MVFSRLSVYEVLWIQLEAKSDGGRKEMRLDLKIEVCENKQCS
jgi:hypothetical protein